MLASLVQVTQCLHIQVDWTKTRGWCADPQHGQQLQAQAAQTLNRDVDLHLVTSARDLGYTKRYKQKQSRTTQDDRHALKLQRLQRLQELEVDIDTKAEIARSSCLTKACQPHIANMRLSAKNPRSGNYTMQMSLIHARDYMHLASQAERQQFFRIVATSNQHPGRSTGPAAALQRYLSKVTWFSDRNGDLAAPFDVPLNILRSNLEDLLQVLRLVG